MKSDKEIGAEGRHRTYLKFQGLLEKEGAGLEAAAKGIAEGIQANWVKFFPHQTKKGYEISKKDGPDFRTRAVFHKMIIEAVGANAPTKLEHDFGDNIDEISIKFVRKEQDEG